MIKPEFWEDEIIGTLTMGARLLFIGMWNIADDEGLLRFNAAYLKSSIFIYDTGVDLISVEAFMNELLGAKLVFSYVGGVSNQKYCYIINFKKHQKIDKPQPSKLPAPSIQNPKIKYMYFERDKFLCHLCNNQCKTSDNSSWCKSSYPSIDHVIAVSKGGTDYPSNIKTACITCNKGRGNEDIEEVKNDSRNDSPNNSENYSGTNISKEKEENKINEVNSLIPRQGQEEKKINENSEELTLSVFLWDLIKQNNPKAKKPDLQKWSREIDKMLRLDSRTFQEIEFIIRWSQQDSFWKTNILSATKLREKFDQLFIKAKSQFEKKVFEKTKKESKTAFIS